MCALLHFKTIPCQRPYQLDQGRVKTPTESTFAWIDGPHRSLLAMSCPTTCDPTSKPKVLISTYLGRKISGPVGLVTTLAIIGYFEVNKQDSCLAKQKTK
jgi:hypothetical protein